MDTILLDLDGTLLPMDQQAFMKVYFEELTKKCAAHGFDPAVIPGAVWAGTKAMMNNDGGATNEEVFWSVFAGQLGNRVLDLKPVLEKFYDEEFDRARVATQPNPHAPKLVKTLRDKGYTLVLASNPVFPAGAYRTRLSWTGLVPEDFAMMTSYESFHYCKPNPGYYAEILERMGKQPQQCLMVGNDVREDGSAKALGMEVHLLTDHLINGGDEDLSAHNSTSFQEFYDLARSAIQPVAI